jgi:outer membrane protein assembly factor BamB
VVTALLRTQFAIACAAFSPADCLRRSDLSPRGRPPSPAVMSPITTQSARRCPPAAPLRPEAPAMYLPLLLALALRAGPPAVDTWPGFRGDGSSRTAARDLPLRWSPAEGIAWRTALPGYGQSAPVVWRGRVFLTAVQGRQKEKCLVVAVEGRTGNLLWRRELPASQPGANNPSMSRAAPTPVADADGVYAFFETGDLVALDHDGKVKWQRSLVKEHGAFRNHHGLASSLAQTNRAVIALVDRGGPSYLLAVEKRSGKTLWKAGRKGGLSWTSPVVVTHGGRALVLVSSAGSLTAYDAGTGKELWELGCLHGNLIPSPAAADGLVVVGAGESGLTSDRKAAARSNCCVRLTLDGGKAGSEVLWRASGPSATTPARSSTGGTSTS